mmetsp:Transcript_31937/g.52706  ORF Transcript_31937/g.52706 Transcript_31937/m.52706 type:complete len:581 (-) Transcript_31937:1311-3053(-)|eukprot:CAMPEP_0119020992 /NCGR_PEP_ID=MMETSP1176-20130426/25104_1 /TAXON_ID=265551 /ORGANISM="Synedropsis recta cf, Strain CCMP1620" /LENGTH=580 /DNA_ID=CAMNT_0006975507 /DNA_START=66 /DNA_END=1808 /DNA_ORIENTATION=+
MMPIPRPSAIHRAFSLVLFALVYSSSLAAPCTLCEDGSFPNLPDTIVNIPPIRATSCEDIEKVIPLLVPDEKSENCVVLRSIASVCGCPHRSDACNLCPDGSSVPLDNKHLELPEFATIVDDTLFTCELYAAYLHSVSKSETLCRASQDVAAFKCGCPGAEAPPPNVTFVDSGDSLKFDRENLRVSFFGAESQSEIDTLNAILRSSAALSILGALLVIQDTLRSPTRRKSLFNWIVSIMALFDIIYSVAIALGDIPRPSGDVLGSRGERGNNATCKAQGWFIQWGGMTSLFFNASLSTYYILVIVYNSRGTRLLKLRKWLIGIPLLLGLIIACASLPFISSSIQGCHIPPPSSSLHQTANFEGASSSWGPYLGLYIIPAFLVIIFTTFVMLRVYLHVRKINMKAQKWRFNAKNASSTTSASQNKSSVTSSNLSSQRRQPTRNAAANFQSELAVQSAMYLIALYLCWFIYLIVAVLLDRVATSHYPLWCFVYFVLPLQGFLNSVTYFRPRMVKKFQRWKLQRRKNAISKMASSATMDDNAPNSRMRSIKDSVSMDVEQAVAVTSCVISTSTSPEDQAVTGT